MSPVSVIGAALSLLLLGCGQSPSNPPPPSAAAAKTAEAPPEPDHAAALGEMTQALRKFSAEQRRVPASLNELVSGGYLKQLPSAPSGKTFAIDPKSLTVVLQ